MHSMEETVYISSLLILAPSGDGISPTPPTTITEKIIYSEQH